MDGAGVVANCSVSMSLPDKKASVFVYCNDSLILCAAGSGPPVARTVLIFRSKLVADLCPLDGAYICC